MPIVVDQKYWGAEYVQAVEPHKVRDGLTWYDTVNKELKVWHADTSSWRWVSTGSGARFGYVCGGYGPAGETSSYSGIQRVDFPFDLAVAHQVGVTESEYNLYSAGCNSSNYGYLIGGFDSPSPRISLFTVKRFDFPFQSGNAITVGSTTGKYKAAGFNSSQHGFAAAGFIRSPAAFYSNIDRITFPFDSGGASNVGNLTGERYNVSALNSSNQGYVIGGETEVFISGTVTWYSNVDRVIFPFNSGVASHTSNMRIAGSDTASCNSSEFGYITGLAQTIKSSYVDRITFPFNSGTSSTTGNLAYGVSKSSGMNSSKQAYICSGIDGSRWINFQTFDFPFDSGVAARRGVLSQSTLNSTAIDGVDFVTQLI